MRLIDADELKDDGANYEWAQVMDHGFAYKEHRFVNRKQIDDAPTIEAIPIEWIEKYMDKVDVEDYGMVYLLPRGPFKKMLKDWEKENE